MRIIKRMAIMTLSAAFPFIAAGMKKTLQTGWTGVFFF